MYHYEHTIVFSMLAYLSKFTTCNLNDSDPDPFSPWMAEICMIYGYGYYASLKLAFFITHVRALMIVYD